MAKEKVGSGRITYHYARYFGGIAMRETRSSRIPRSAGRWAERVGLYDASHLGVVAYRDGEMIGFFRYQVFPAGDSPRPVICAAGTWVARSARKSGVARRLWELAFQKYRPVEVEVCVASVGGYMFVHALRKKHQEFRWDVTVPRMVARQVSLHVCEKAYRELDKDRKKRARKAT